MGPAFSEGILPAGGALSTEQVFLAGQKAVVALVPQPARQLGLRIVAEGVEDASVLDALRALGCDIAQGYHIGRPGTSEQLMALLDCAAGEPLTNRQRPVLTVAT